MANLFDTTGGGRDATETVNSGSFSEALSNLSAMGWEATRDEREAQQRERERREREAAQRDSRLRSFLLPETKERRPTPQEPKQDEPTRAKQSIDAFLAAQQRSLDFNVGAVKGVGEAAFNLVTGKESARDVASGAGNETLRGMSTAGENIVDVTTGGRAEELRDRYRESRSQYNRSTRNVQRNRDPIGQIGAVLEAGADFSLDQPGASVQDRLAREAGGRQRIAETYQRTATGIDDTLERAPVRISSRNNRFVKWLSEMTVAPSAQGVAATLTGTDVATGGKTDATAENLVDTWFAPFDVLAGGAVVKTGGKAALRTTATNPRMVNPIRLLSGIFRSGDEVADAARFAERSSTARRVTGSADNLPDAARRLEDLPDVARPQRVESASQNIRNTNLDTVRFGDNPGRTAVREGVDNLPARLDRVETARRAERGEDTNTLMHRLLGDADNPPGSSRWEPRRMVDADNLDDLEDVFPAGRAGRSTGTRRATAEASTVRERLSSLADRLRGSDEAAQARRTNRASDAADTASDSTRTTRYESSGTRRRARQAASTSDEGADATRRATRTAARQGDEAAQRAAQSRRAERASEAGENAGLLGRIRRWAGNNPGKTVIGGGLLGGIATGALMDPPSMFSGDGWSAHQTKTYNVEGRDGPTQVFQYRVDGDGGETLGYTVVLGQDEEGTIYYLGGNTSRPSSTRSRVKGRDLAEAERRYAQQGGAM